MARVVHRIERIISGEINWGCYCMLLNTIAQETYAVANCHHIFYGPFSLLSEAFPSLREQPPVRYAACRGTLRCKLR